MLVSVQQGCTSDKMPHAYIPSCSQSARINGLDRVFPQSSDADAPGSIAKDVSFRGIIYSVCARRRPYNTNETESFGYRSVDSLRVLRPECPVIQDPRLLV